MKKKKKKKNGSGMGNEKKWKMEKYHRKREDATRLCVHFKTNRMRNKYR